MTTWSSARNKARRYPPNREPRPLGAAGVQRRVIEGEGLGGFARRHSLNALIVNRFRAAQRFFSRRVSVGFWPAIAWNWPSAGKPVHAAPPGLKDRREH